MGGIVVRRFLVANQVRLIDLQPKIGLFLVASPSLGSRDANLLSVLSYVLQHTQGSTLRFSQAITSLDELHRDFRTLLTSGRLSIVGRELTEDKAILLKRWLGLRRQVVEPFSAAAYFHQQGYEPFRVPGSDHVTIVKPLSESAIQHQMLKSFLLGFTNTRLHTETALPTQWMRSSRSAHDEVSSSEHIDEGSEAYPGFHLGFGVPQLTRRMVERSLLRESICKILVSPATSPHNCLLHGSGGAGKSTLASMIANNEAVRANFPDGIFWISLGPKPDIAARQALWTRFLPNRPATFTSPEASTAFLSEYFKKRRALLIIDDVWDASDLMHFVVGGPGCSLLMTTREMKVASAIEARILDVGTLSSGEAEELILLRSDGLKSKDEQLPNLVRMLGNLPLALELAAYQLRIGASVPELVEALRDEASALNSLDVPGYLHEQTPELARNMSLIACLNLSIKRLSPEGIRDFAELSVLEPNRVFSAKLVMKLWNNSDINTAGKTLRSLRSMSLLEMGRTRQSKRYQHLPDAFAG